VGRLTGVSYLRYSGFLITGYRKKIMKRTVKKLERPVLKLDTGHLHCITALSPMHVSNSVQDDKDPATLLPVQVLESTDANVTIGGEYIIVVPTAIKQRLEENYPNDGYVSKSFDLQMDVQTKRTANGNQFRPIKCLDEVEFTTDSKK